MTQVLKFTKMHGAGNDFVMIDAPDLQGLKLNASLIEALCNRRTGVGADGLIIIDKPSNPKSAFSMVYFNADGHEAEMCGNGARCSVAFAHQNGMAEVECFFDTYSGTLSGRVFASNDIQVSLPAWNDLTLDLNLGNQKFPDHHACNTGVPHLVIPVPDVAQVEVQKHGHAYRYHEQFSPAGTNVNFVSQDPNTGDQMLRTYERGVEDETLACGTGASATAVVLCKLGLAQSPVSLHTRGGDVLCVSVDFEDRKLLLRGPAETSFCGEVKISILFGNKQ